MDKSKMHRRSLLKASAATAGFAALGGAPILGSMRHAMAQGALAGEQLRTIGLSVTVQDRILQDFQEAERRRQRDRHGRDLSGCANEDPVRLEGLRLLGDHRRAPAGFGGDQQGRADPDGPNSRTGRISAAPSPRPIQNSRRRRRSPARSGPMTRIPSCSWCLPSTTTTASATTRIWWSAEEANTWTCLFDDKFRGKSGLNTDPLIATGQAIMAMNTLGLSGGRRTPAIRRRRRSPRPRSSSSPRRRTGSSARSGAISASW